MGSRTDPGVVQPVAVVPKDNPSTITERTAALIEKGKELGILVERRVEPKEPVSEVI